MKYLCVFLFGLLLSFPVLSGSCRIPSASEVEIVYINGIATNYSDFRKNVKRLDKSILRDYPLFSEYTSVHNETWGKPLDIVQSLAQIEQEYIRDYVVNNKIGFRNLMDVKLLGYALYAANMSMEDQAYIQQKIGSDAQLKASYGIFPGGGKSALGNTWAMAMLKKKYADDVVRTYNEQFNDNLPELSVRLLSKLENLMTANKPFIILGHSQGTIVAKQVYTILEDFIDRDKQPYESYKSNLFGRYELASMNAWKSDDIANLKTNYLVLASDTVQSWVDNLINLQTLGAYDIVNYNSPSTPWDPISSPLDIYSNTTLDALGHGLVLYAGEFNNLDERSISALDKIRQNLRVCDEPEAEPIELAECGAQTRRIFFSGTGIYHFDLGQKFTKANLSFWSEDGDPWYSLSVNDVPLGNVGGEPEYYLYNIRTGDSKEFSRKDREYVESQRRYYPNYHIRRHLFYSHDFWVEENKNNHNMATVSVIESKYNQDAKWSLQVGCK